jgi:hypothetical protein
LRSRGHDADRQGESWGTSDMLRSIPLALAGLMLLAGLVFGDPRVRVEYHSGVPQIRLDGSYPGSRYTVYRAGGEPGPFEAISDFNTLCAGPCYADDYDALPGLVYWYRFDLELPDGSLVRFGPYAVTISPEFVRVVSAAVFPNPGAAQTRVQLFLAGSPTAPPLDASAAVFDVQGRVIRMLHRGPLARGTTRIEWDGRDDGGRPLGTGMYYLRFSTPLGATTTTILRIR